MLVWEIQMRSGTNSWPNHPWAVPSQNEPTERRGADGQISAKEPCDAGSDASAIHIHVGDEEKKKYPQADATSASAEMSGPGRRDGFAEAICAVREDIIRLRSSETEEDSPPAGRNSGRAPSPGAPRSWRLRACRPCVFRRLLLPRRVAYYCGTCGHLILSCSKLGLVCGVSSPAVLQIQDDGPFCQEPANIFGGAKTRSRQACYFASLFELFSCVEKHRGNGYLISRKEFR